MFSVGLILYELYYSFGTDMEKLHVFKKLRANEEIDEEFVKTRPVEVCSSSVHGFFQGLQDC